MSAASAGEVAVAETSTMFDSPSALTLRSALTSSFVNPCPSSAAVLAAMSPSWTSFRFVFC